MYGSAMEDVSKLEPTPTWFQRRITQAGWGLMLSSFGFWAAIPVLPFLPLSTGQQVAGVGVLLVGAEIVFWLGALLAGPDALRRMKSWWDRSASERPASIEPIPVEVQERANPS